MTQRQYHFKQSSWICFNYRIQELSFKDVANTETKIPCTFDCDLTRDLVGIVHNGDQLCVSGTVKRLLVLDNNGQKSKIPISTLYIDANSIIKTSHSSNKNKTGFSNNKIVTTNMNLINKILQFERHIFKLLVNSLCPSIYGHEMVKAGLLLGVIGSNDDKSGSMAIRGNPHMYCNFIHHSLVVGDAGLGKSQLLCAIDRVSPKCISVSGTSCTTAGLSVTLTNDARMMEPGALGTFLVNDTVLANDGVCCIDEFDKMKDPNVLLEVMAQQSVTVYLYLM